MRMFVMQGTSGNKGFVWFETTKSYYEGSNIATKHEVRVYFVNEKERGELDKISSEMEGIRAEEVERQMKTGKNSGFGAENPHMKKYWDLAKDKNGILSGKAFEDKMIGFTKLDPNYEIRTFEKYQKEIKNGLIYDIPRIQNR